MKEANIRGVFADAQYDLNEIARALVQTIDTVKEVQRQAEEAGSEEKFIQYAAYVTNKVWGTEIKIPKKYFEEGFLYGNPGSDEALFRKYLATWRELHMLNTLVPNSSTRETVLFKGGKRERCICVSENLYECCKRLLQQREERERALRGDQRSTDA